MKVLKKNERMARALAFKHFVDHGGFDSDEIDEKVDAWWTDFLTEAEDINTALRLVQYDMLDGDTEYAKTRQSC